MKRMNGIILAALLATAAIAQAQPAPPDSYPDPYPGNGSNAPQPGDGSGTPTPTPTPTPDDKVVFPDPTQPPVEGEGPTMPPPAPKPHVPRPALYMPQVLTTPTGWLLPAAVLYSKTQLDTGGGVTSDQRVGLGDVAEFGVATTDAVRERATATSPSSRIQPYVTASFRLGVAEDRLFPHQPGIALGFRKSFERNHDNFKTRIAELTLVASKHLGKRTAIHVGGAFWDASLQETGGEELTLHGGDNLRRQVRAFGGIQVMPIDRSEILIDLGWSPEFCYRCDGSPGNEQIRLRPELSWGVRYHVADWLRLESGVRVPDIGSANLLDAQIFGGLTFTTWALRRGVDSLK